MISPWIFCNSSFNFSISFIFSNVCDSKWASDCPYFSLRSSISAVLFSRASLKFFAWSSKALVMLFPHSSFCWALSSFNLLMTSDVFALMPCYVTSLFLSTKLLTIDKISLTSVSTSSNEHFSLTVWCSSAILAAPSKFSLMHWFEVNQTRFSFVSFAKVFPLMNFSLLLSSIEKKII